jgi:hypothetical protein
MNINITGLIPILGGVCLTLIAHRAILTNLQSPEKMELWHRKFGKMSKVLGPALIVFGLLQLFRVL